MGVRSKRTRTLTMNFTCKPTTPRLQLQVQIARDRQKRAPLKFNLSLDRCLRKGGVTKLSKNSHAHGMTEETGRHSKSTYPAIHPSRCAKQGEKETDVSMTKRESLQIISSLAYHVKVGRVGRARRPRFATWRLLLKLFTFTCLLGLTTCTFFIT